MSSYTDYKTGVIKNEEVRTEYDALEPEYDLIQAMIDARVGQNITQKELSDLTELHRQI